MLIELKITGAGERGVPENILRNYCVLKHDWRGLLVFFKMV